MDTLANMERVEVDKEDRPIEDLIVERSAVFVDPFAEVDEELAKERAEQMEATRATEVKVAAAKKKQVERKVFGTGVGKYINPTLKREARRADSSSDQQQPAATTAKKKKKAGGFGDFSSW